MIQFEGIKEHNTKPFNTYISKNWPWSLVALFSSPEEKWAAMKIEMFIKMQKSQHFTERIIFPNFNNDGVFTQLKKCSTP